MSLETTELAPKSLTETAENEGSVDQSLSKNEQKRRAKRAKFLMERDAWKAKMKIQKAARKQERRQKVQPNDNEATETVISEKGIPRTKLQQSPIVPIIPLEEAPTLVIDLDFDGFMLDKEKVSLINQIGRCYSANRRTEYPLRIAMTSLTEKWGSFFDSKAQGWRKWTVDHHQDAYLNAFPRENIVYLTADSPNVLSTLNKDTFYIIGGLVDRNRYKNLCHERAVAAGIATARLPIEEHVKMLACKALTINQVFEIILANHRLKDWNASLAAVIPARKKQRDTQKTTSQDLDDNESSSNSEIDLVH